MEYLNSLIIGKWQVASGLICTGLCPTEAKQSAFRQEMHFSWQAIAKAGVESSLLNLAMVLRY